MNNAEKFEQNLLKSSAVDFLQTTITVSLLFGNYNFINN